METPKHIVDMMKKNELSVCDVGSLLEYAGKLAQAMPESVLRSVETAQEDAQALVGAAERMIAWQEQFQSKLEVAEEELLKRFDELYKLTIKKRGEFMQKLSEIEPMPEVRIPYNLKELCEIAERFSHLSDDTWQRVIDLSKTLK